MTMIDKPIIDPAVTTFFQNTSSKFVSDGATYTTAIFQSFLELLEGWGETVSDFFVPKSVKKLVQDPKASKAAADALKKQKKERTELQKTIIAKHHQVLKQPISILEKIKSLVNLPKEILPYIDIFFAKGTKLELDVGLEDELTFSTDLKLASKGVKGRVHVTLPTTAPIVSTEDEMPVDLHPALKGLLGAKLSPLFSKDLDVTQIVDLLLTLPSQQMNITYDKGNADITLVLPSGVIFRVVLATETQATGDTDIVRSFLKGVLKENFAGIEPLLGETFSFIWDGSTSQFKFNFAQQQALKINTLKLKGEGFLQTLAAKIGENSSIVIPQTIAGKIDFKNTSIQFEPGTKLILQGFFPWDKNVDINHISYDIEKNTVQLSIDCFGNHIIPIKLDKPKESEESPLQNIDFKFIPFIDPQAKKIDEKKKQAAEIKPTIGPQQKQSLVLSQIKNLIKIPEAFVSYLSMIFVKGTALHADIDIQDNISFSTEVNIPGGGISGRIFLTAPMNPVSTDASPVKMNDKLLGLITEQLQSLGSEDDINQLIAMIAMLPEQNVYVRWIGSSNMAKLDLSLPGGAHLKLDLILDKKSNMVETVLSKILKDNYKGIAPLLLQDYALTWNGSSKKFTVEFLEQQAVHIDAVKLKGEGFIQDVVGKIIKGSRIVIPETISGTIDFQKIAVKFDPGTKFLLKGLLPFDKEIDFDQVTFRPENNAIDLKIKCFGTHQATIDLNTSNVDKVSLGIVPTLPRRLIHSRLPPFAMMP